MSTTGEAFQGRSHTTHVLCHNRQSPASGTLSTMLFVGPSSNQPATPKADIVQSPRLVSQKLVLLREPLIEEKFGISETVRHLHLKH